MCEPAWVSGITEAGTTWAGTVKSAVGLGALLYDGIGDTLRVSLTGDPVEEVRVGWEILKSLELRERGPVFVSCPTCGRCHSGSVREACLKNQPLPGAQEAGAVLPSWSAYSSMLKVCT
mgnify:CR=1 FL=1